MRLEMGRRADYGIRAAVDLARHYHTGNRRKAREIAEAIEIAATYVPHVLADLVHAGLAESVAGPAGGYRLSLPPDEISLLAVIRAVDDDPSARVCVMRDGPCSENESCSIHDLWVEAQQAMLGRLDQATLADVTAVHTALDAGTTPERSLPHNEAAPAATTDSSR